MEAAAQAAAENVKKNGICVIPIRVANFFSAGQYFDNLTHYANSKGSKLWNIIFKKVSIRMITCIIGKIVI